MNGEEKRVYMLLKSVIFHYHGLDDDEIKNLEDTAAEIGAEEELQWANQFIAKDYLTSFERARVYLNDHIGDYSKEKRIEYIKMVWDANSLKGFITELEMTAMLKLAQDWRVEEDLKALVMSNIKSNTKA